MFRKFWSLGHLVNIFWMFSTWVAIPSVEVFSDVFSAVSRMNCWIRRRLLVFYSDGSTGFFSNHFAHRGFARLELSQQRLQVMHVSQTLEQMNRSEVWLSRVPETWLTALLSVDFFSTKFFFFFLGGDWLNVTWRVFFFLGVVSSRFLLFGSTNLRQNTIEEEKENTWKHLILFQEEVVNNGLREFFLILPGLTLESHSSWISGGQWGKWSTWVETVPGAPPENVGTKECPCTSSMMRTWETWEQHLEGLEIGRRSHGYIQYRLVQ